MEATITVSSEPGVGSRFVFTVDLGLATHEAAQDSRLKAPGRRALVVDDNASARAILGEIVRTWSMSVTEAGSGAEALSRIDAATTAGRPFDLMLIDAAMPGFSGVETSRVVRRRPGKGPVIVLLASPYGRESVAADAADAGVDAIAIKPVERAGLAALVAPLLGISLNDPAAGEGDAAAPPSSTGLAGAHLLVAEDNAINQFVAVEFLSALGVTCRIVGDGDQAVEALLAEPDGFDGVLMDIQMPVMDGLAATREIRRALPGLHSLPIIAMTAHALASERERCLAAGMNDHLAKPIDPAALAAVLNRWIRKRRDRPAPTAATDPAPPASPASGTAIDTAPPFDLTVARSRCNGNERLLNRILAEFVRSTATGASEIRRLTAAGSWREVERFAHTMKSTAAIVGLDRLSATAQEIESLCRQGDIDEVANRVDRFVIDMIAEADRIRLAVPNLLT